MVITSGSGYMIGYLSFIVTYEDKIRPEFGTLKNKCSQKLENKINITTCKNSMKTKFSFTQYV